MSFIAPEEAFTNYEDNNGIDGNVVTIGSRQVNHAGLKVTRDDDRSEGGPLRCVGVCLQTAKRILGRDHRSRFVYSNGWNTNGGRKCICKEDDMNWSLTREQQYNMSCVSDPCTNIFFSFFFLAIFSVLAGNNIPRWQKVTTTLVTGNHASYTGDVLVLSEVIFNLFIYILHVHSSTHIQIILFMCWVYTPATYLIHMWPHIYVCII